MDEVTKKEYKEFLKKYPNADKILKTEEAINSINVEIGILESQILSAKETINENRQRVDSLLDGICSHQSSILILNEEIKIKDLAIKDTKRTNVMISERAEKEEKKIEILKKKLEEQKSKKKEFPEFNEVIGSYLEVKKKFKERMKEEKKKEKEEK